MSSVVSATSDICCNMANVDAEYCEITVSSGSVRIVHEDVNFVDVDLLGSGK